MNSKIEQPKKEKKIEPEFDFVKTIDSLKDEIKNLKEHIEKVEEDKKGETGQEIDFPQTISSLKNEIKDLNYRIEQLEKEKKKSGTERSPDFPSDY